MLSPLEPYKHKLNPYLCCKLLLFVVLGAGIGVGILGGCTGIGVDLLLPDVEPSDATTFRWRVIR